MPRVQFRAYLASPLGFSESSRHYMDNVLVPALEEVGVLVVNPWKLTTDAEFAAVSTMPEGAKKKRARADLYYSVGRRNRVAIDHCDVVIAFLDGQELDAGTVAEVGYAVGRNMTVYGIRTDLRQSGEHGAEWFNLQVEYFIEMSGGRMFKSLDEIKTFARGVLKIFGE